MATTAPSEPVQFNPFEPGFVEDPYPQYDRLRTEDPVHHSFLGSWVLTRYRDVQSVLRDPRAGSTGLFEEEERKVMLQAFGLWDAWQASVVRDTITASILFQDPPDHTRLRALVSKAFTPRAVTALEPRVQEIVDDLLGPAAEAGRVEIVGDLAFPLPALVICELLGVPPEDRHTLRDWSGAATVLVEPFMGPDEFTAADAALRELFAYFGALADERRRAPRADLLSSLIAAEEEGDRLSQQELLVTAILLFAAGHETTKNLIGTGMWTLLRHRDQLERLRVDPALVPAAVEECLRYESPVQVNARRMKENVEIDGTRIAAGERIVNVLGAANRDPDEFVDPAAFDIGRAENRPISFGSGIHFCLGAALARLEARLAIGTLVRRFPEIELVDDEPKWRHSFTLRGMTELPVALGRPAA